MSDKQMTMKMTSTIATLAVFWTLACAGAPFRVPDEAYQNAERELVSWKAKWSEDPVEVRALLQMSSGPRVSLEHANLGEPYVSLVIHNSDILKWNPETGLNFRELAHAYVYSFPIMVDDVYVATLNDGGGWIGASETPRRMAEISNEFPDSVGYSVYLSGTLALGILMIVECPNEAESLVFALDDKAAELVSAEQGTDSHFRPIFEPVLLTTVKHILYQELNRYRDELIERGN